MKNEFFQSTDKNSIQIIEGIIDYMNEGKKGKLANIIYYYIREN